jgi:hypothetical protein
VASEEELTSADESSDDDEEGGRSHQPGSGNLTGSLQRHHGDRRRDHVKARFDAAAQGSHVPPLALDRMRANKGKGWRRLKKTHTRGLVSKATSTHTQHAKVRLAFRCPPFFVPSFSLPSYIRQRGRVGGGVGVSHSHSNERLLCFACRGRW